jgi:1-acyl-sn-glycerol-3-phosphate acyltransferase
MEEPAGKTGAAGRKKNFSSAWEKQVRDDRNNHDYRETLFTKVGFYCLKKTLGPLVRGLWIKKVEGLEYLPAEGPVIVASNHASYLDFICFVAVSPRNIHYLAAEKFFRSPFWRPIMDLSGQIKVDRFRGNKRHTMCQVHSALDQGRVIGIFPEGTRSPDGTIQSAYSGVARFALASKAPVVPVGVIGAYDVWPREQTLPRLAREIHIRIGEPLSFDAYHDIDPEEDHFLEVTETIMGKIRELTGQYPEPVKAQMPGRVDQ